MLYEVITIRLRDEPKTLRLVEPLHSASRHFETPVVSGSEDPYLPPITPRLRPVSVTDAPIDRGRDAQKKDSYNFV